MHYSLLLSFLAAGALARWRQDGTLIRAAASWRASVSAELCALRGGRVEAGRRNITAAAAALDVDPTAALERWAALHTDPACPRTNLQWDVRAERHDDDQGVNWIMSWREGA